MRIHVAGLLLVASTAGPVAAQSRLVPVPERRSAGLMVGVSGNGDRNSGHHGIDVDAMFEAPLMPTWRARIDLGRASWPFDKQEGAPGAPLRDTVTVRRVTASVIRSVAPAFETVRFGFYVGGGIGGYHYSFKRGTGAVPTRFGMHGLGGVEIIPPNNRIAIVGELRLDAIRGPKDSQVFSHTLFTIATSAGVRLRW
jgi:hypothetical protein